MTRRLLFCPLMLLVLPLATFGEDRGGKLPTAPTNTEFEKLKTLAGTWMAADEDGKPTDQVMSIIRVTLASFSSSFARAASAARSTVG